MKKIGILTFHKAYNYGAFMQAYSLAGNLNKFFKDCVFEIIDYVHLNDRLRYIVKVPLWSFINFGMRAAVQQFEKFIAFSKDWSYLQISEKSVISNKAERLNRLLQEYDAIIVGSDAVFNDSGFNGISPFFLSDIEGPHKYSYAASAHGLNYTKYSDNERKALCRAFNAMKIIGTRDVHTENFVKFCGEVTSPLMHCCDPTIVLNMDCPRGELENKLKRYKINNRKCIITMLKNDSCSKLVREWFGDEYLIIAVASPNHYAHIFMSNLSPLEWSHIFTYAKFTVTDYFHGTIMSLKNGTPTVTLDPMENTPTMQTKIYDLLNNRLNLPQYYFAKNEIKREMGLARFEAQCRENLVNRNEHVIGMGLAKESETFYAFCNQLAKDEGLETNENSVCSLS